MESLGVVWVLINIINQKSGSCLSLPVSLSKRFFTVGGIKQTLSIRFLFPLSEISILNVGESVNQENQTKASIVSCFSGMVHIAHLQNEP